MIIIRFVKNLTTFEKKKKTSEKKQKIRFPSNLILNKWIKTDMDLDFFQGRGGFLKNGKYII